MLVLLLVVVVVGRELAEMWGEVLAPMAAQLSGQHLRLQAKTGEM
jgi:hypothetical protein